MTYIIHGATGAQGSPVLAAMLAAGNPAVAAVRTLDAVNDGVASVAVDLADAGSLAEAYAGADGVFVHLPMGPPEQSLQYVEAIATAVAKAKPARVVISTSGQIVDQPGSPLQANDDSPIATLIRRVGDTGVSTAVVATRLYLENLLLPVVSGSATLDGVLRYPLPTAFATSWISHSDVAEVVVRLLTDHSTTGIVAVGAHPGLTGPDLAAAFAGRLGRDVTYEAITPEAFGELISPLFGPEASGPVVDLYQALNTQERNTIAPDNSAQSLLGISPRSVEDWLANVPF
ncbi:SDR family oxidoreductase [Nocardioides panzhihuensis]|uniref:Uncharacterized protein YbjT (DUF2867 family) n=1 Tax=Nocardioides panzhihuensis TaxID=860243 RepID=A0A7Z0IS76_9ACTN|nr:NmrA family NAD(P)-binding protein [Nocardioides panzhihuensis]NYI77661.1 uncharacterized protein YbjT (DUF2867 family) [Nocardioides panzhihuensis]